jgi:glucose/mannose transport system permease protein
VSRSSTWHRALLWTALLLFAAAWFLLPLYVMLSTSLKDMDQSARRPPAVPAHVSPSFDAWAKAWGTACTGVDCGGLQALFHELGADGGAGGAGVHRHRRAQRLRAERSGASAAARLLFALLLFGVFMPMQVVLLPMSQVLGWLGIASSIWGLILVHVVAGMPQHHAVLPQLLRRRAR